METKDRDAKAEVRSFDRQKINTISDINKCLEMNSKNSRGVIKMLKTRTSKTRRSQLRSI